MRNLLVNELVPTWQVSAAVLQYRNQKLVQKLDVQKHELHNLEARIKELKDKQASYDEILITVNQLWNQVASSFAGLIIRGSLYNLFL